MKIQILKIPLYMRINICCNLGNPNRSYYQDRDNWYTAKLSFENQTLYILRIFNCNFKSLKEKCHCIGNILV